MNSEQLFEKYKVMLYALQKVIQISGERVIQPEPDELFIENINLFIKAYLVSICTHLESYLQELAFNHATQINNRIQLAKIPTNFATWRITPKYKTADLKYEILNLEVSKKDVSENISGNPYRTIALFRLLGIQIENDADFQSKRSIVNSIVEKRNNIIHHNDNANDITFNDLISYIENVIIYMSGIKKALQAQTT